VTASDDLARTLAEHVYWADWDDNGGVTACTCGWRGSDHRAHLAEVLASVVSRRDTDLQAEAWDEGRAAGWWQKNEEGNTGCTRRADNPYRSRPPADTDTRSEP
jgi:hypothetical protein